MPNATAPAPALVRKAASPDLPAVERIEREQFPNPWSREYYAAELENTLSHFYVAEGADGVVAGYLLFWRLGAELELHKLAVAGERQQRGYASALLDFFLGSGRRWGCERAVLEVRASNLPAIRLYEKFAFGCVGRRRDYYDRPVEDALLFEVRFR
ncbi:MAG: ribosomal protein S18-alanine N-acetyltransferase [Candidatus Aminicenantes bacterium]|nr:ribosomal protein S18-alanine N-acetyltransferase [Candidatus Aminicenantes bacterium]